jgi:hypothetical protein
MQILIRNTQRTDILFPLIQNYLKYKKYILKNVKIKITYGLSFVLDNNVKIMGLENVVSFIEMNFGIKHLIQKSIDHNINNTNK